MVTKNTLFTKPKSPRLARLVDLTSPTAFKEGLRKAKKGGFTLQEKRAFVQGRNIAGAQLKRKNLSMKERKQFRAIMNTKLPKITK